MTRKKKEKKSLHQHKQNHNRLNRDGTSSSFFFLPGVDASRVYVRARALYVASTVILVSEPFGGR